MQTSTLVINEAQRIAAAGHDAAIIDYLDSQQRRELEESPSLALLYGTAQARIGRAQEGLYWLDLALEQARKQEDRSVERRALNARGAVALASGRLDEAADYFTQGVMIASRDGDLATTGRCSNNLGIINSLRGRYAEALGSWEIAVAAYGQAGQHEGAAECRHNLGIVYREQGNLERAMVQADHAVAEAVAANDVGMRATALRGRAEVLLALGDAENARREMDNVAAIREIAPDPAREAEDKRVVALIVQARGNAVDAERMLREVIVTAEAQGRPHLQGEATRDLAILLYETGRTLAAREAVRVANDIFVGLGATGEARMLANREWGDNLGNELRRSLEPLHEAQRLADSGHYAELLAVLAKLPQAEVEQSPMLSMLCGIAHGRLGQLPLAWEWALKARSRSNALGDRTTEMRALNVCGAIALERGGIEEATQFFTEAQEHAVRENDMTAVGRSANNLGVIANLIGEYGQAVGAYTRAMGAYQQVSFDRGIAESLHNLAITYREQGRLDDALQTADDALTQAEAVGDELLKAQALAGRAEIRIARGEASLAVREVEEALNIHRKLQDPVRESEDLRILADALGAAGDSMRAEALLRQVIDRATENNRAQLIAASQRDLAQLLWKNGRQADARRLAATARETFERLGARSEVEKLNALLEPH